MSRRTNRRTALSQGKLKRRSLEDNTAKKQGKRERERDAAVSWQHAVRKK